MEIKFRGKYKNRWVYGYYKYNPIRGSHIIIETGGIPPTYSDSGGDCYYEEFEVDPKTIGQFINLHDKNGKEIYVKDICKLLTGDSNESYEIGIIDFFQGSFTFTSQNGMQYPNEYLLAGIFDGEVIGNQFENPELLKPEKEN